MAVIRRFMMAVKKTVLTSVAIHLTLIVVYAVQTGNFKILNLFNILELDLYFPVLIQGAVSDILAFSTLLVMLGIYFFFS